MMYRRPPEQIADQTEARMPDMVGTIRTIPPRFNNPQNPDKGIIHMNKDS